MHTSTTSAGSTGSEHVSGSSLPSNRDHLNTKWCQLKKKKKKTTQQPVTFATYKKANKTLQDWVARLTLFHTSSISLLPVWSGLASPGPVPLGTWHHSGWYRSTGTHPTSHSSRGTDLPYPAVFLPKACGHSLLGCSAGQEGVPSASRGCLQPLPFQLLDQKDYTGDAASAVPGERKRRLKTGAGRLGSSEHSTRAEPQMLQHCG